MIYLDSSALLKLLFEEAESTALESWLEERSDLPRVSSEIAKVEVIRSCRRLDAAAVPAARSLVDSLDLVPLSGPVIEEASSVGGDTLRSLDALHLASALELGEDLAAVIAYDNRLTEAAAALGLPTVAPGQSG